MGRFPQSVGTKGSKKWIQRLINDQPEILNEQIKRNLRFSNDDEIQWRSPLKDDNYAEYRDQDVIARALNNIKVCQLRFSRPIAKPKIELHQPS